MSSQYLVNITFKQPLAVAANRTFFFKLKMVNNEDLPIILLFKSMTASAIQLCFVAEATLQLSELGHWDLTLTKTLTELHILTI